MDPGTAKLFGKQITSLALRLRSSVWTTTKILTMQSSLMKAQSGWSAMEKSVSEKREHLANLSLAVTQSTFPDSDYRFQQDNDPKHKSKFITLFFLHSSDTAAQFL